MIRFVQVTPQIIELEPNSIIFCHSLAKAGKTWRRLAKPVVDSDTELTFRILNHHESNYNAALFQIYAQEIVLSSVVYFMFVRFSDVTIFRSLQPHHQWPFFEIQGGPKKIPQQEKLNNSARGNVKLTKISEFV